MGRRASQKMGQGTGRTTGQAAGRSEGAGSGGAAPSPDGGRTPSPERSRTASSDRGRTASTDRGRTGWIRRTGRALRHPFAATGRGIRRATHAHGAGESGLGKLIELHAVNSAGDMMVTIALASTVFFSVPTDEARGRVALYLAITMAPFALLAPVVGPLLDRLPHGRRAAMATAMLSRAVLALGMSTAVAGGGLELYPAALGVLVASKAYGVVRSAVVPRLLPPRFSLVRANSRVTLAGLLATGIAAPVGAGLHQIGPEWPLYGACAVFAAGTFLSFTLPHKVDSAKGEARVQLTSGEHHLHLPHPVHRSASGTGKETSSETAPPKPKRPGLRTVGPSVLHALQACASLKALSGFLTLFLAFLLREHPLAGLSPEVSLGVVVVAAGVGNALGTAIGAGLKARGPERIIVVVLTAALAVLVSAAVLYSTVLVAAVAATAGISQALGKLSLDALIQRDMPEVVRTSAFSRSETTLQLAWVAGGAIGIMLPLNGVVGMAVAAGLIALGTVATVRGLLSAARRGSPHPRVA
ncbi:MFS transporter [Streptomyces sp. XD-27]|uniref:MFS transporter n=1 Tax=Streptomyces sp. XD-27 TaxID=3062779 RepID=UPI0026F43C92|nr:MFS transporter [Streptomyces sp. XD-27]WKX71020.1 MFS transporter [Streptomyces sp. XD-27]